MNHPIGEIFISTFVERDPEIAKIKDASARRMAAEEHFRLMSEDFLEGLPLEVVVVWWPG